MSKAEQYISQDAVHDSPKAIPVPTKTALYNLTKASIVAEGAKLGIDLDMELTRDQMVMTILSKSKENVIDLQQSNDPKRILDMYVDGYTG